MNNKFKKLLTVAFLCSFLLSFFACMGKESYNFFIDKAKLNVEYGNSYYIPNLSAKSTKDNFVDLKHTFVLFDSQNNEIKTSFRTFTPAVGDYKIVYTSTDEKLEGTYIVDLKCVDTTIPELTSSLYKANVFIGEEVELPSFNATDISGIKEGSKTAKLYSPEKIDITSQIFDGKFIPNKSGKFSYIMHSQDIFDNTATKEVFIHVFESWEDLEKESNFLFTFDKSDYINLVFLDNIADNDKISIVNISECIDDYTKLPFDVDSGAPSGSALKVVASSESLIKFSTILSPSEVGIKVEEALKLKIRFASLGRFSSLQVLMNNFELIKVTPQSEYYLEQMTWYEIELDAASLGMYPDEYIRNLSFVLNNANDRDCILYIDSIFVEFKAELDLKDREIIVFDDENALEYVEETKFPVGNNGALIELVDDNIPLKFGKIINSALKVTLDENMQGVKILFPYSIPSDSFDAIIIGMYLNALPEKIICGFIDNYGNIDTKWLIPNLLTDTNLSITTGWKNYSFTNSQAVAQLKGDIVGFYITIYELKDRIWLEKFGDINIELFIDKITFNNDSNNTLDNFDLEISQDNIESYFENVTSYGYGNIGNINSFGIVDFEGKTNVLKIDANEAGGVWIDFKGVLNFNANSQITLMVYLTNPNVNNRLFLGYQESASTISWNCSWIDVGYNSWKLVTISYDQLENYYGDPLYGIYIATRYEGQIYIKSIKVETEKIIYPVDSIELSANNVNLKVNDNYTLQAYLNPLDSQAEVYFTSSNDRVATVDSETGKITAKNVGTAIITAMAGNALATCTVIIDTNFDQINYVFNNNSQLNAVRSFNGGQIQITKYDNVDVMMATVDGNTSGAKILFDNIKVDSLKSFIVVVKIGNGGSISLNNYNGSNEENHLVYYGGETDFIEVDLLPLIISKNHTVINSINFSANPTGFTFYVKEFKIEYIDYDKVDYKFDNPNNLDIVRGYNEGAGLLFNDNGKEVLIIYTAINGGVRILFDNLDVNQIGFINITLKVSVGLSIGINGLEEHYLGSSDNYITTDLTSFVKKYETLEYINLYTTGGSFTAFLENISLLLIPEEFSVTENTINHYIVSGWTPASHISNVDSREYLKIYEGKEAIKITPNSGGGGLGIFFNDALKINENSKIEIEIFIPLVNEGEYIYVGTVTSGKDITNISGYQITAGIWQKIIIEPGTAKFVVGETIQGLTIQALQGSEFYISCFKLI